MITITTTILTTPIGALSVVATVALIAVLAARELASGLDGPRLRRLDEGLALVSVPLLIAFGATAALLIRGSLGL